MRTREIFKYGLAGLLAASTLGSMAALRYAKIRRAHEAEARAHKGEDDLRRAFSPQAASTTPQAPVAGAIETHGPAAKVPAPVTEAP